MNPDGVTPQVIVAVAAHFPGREKKMACTLLGGVISCTCE